MTDQTYHWVDSHCHFDFPAFDSDRQQVWQRASAAGVKELLIPGVTIVQSERLEAFCKQQPWHHAVGMHPYFFDQHEEQHFDRLENLLDQQRAIAVGEIGLDRTLASDHDKLEAQWYWFRGQVGLAQQYGLPLILHIRGMHDEAAAYLRRCHFTQGGVVHAFSGSQQQAKAWMDLGFTLGIGGAMTHARANRLRKTIQYIPNDNILLETDSPDMTPAFWQDKRNTPETIPVIAHSIAALKGISAVDLNDSQLSVFRRIFRLN